MLDKFLGVRKSLSDTADDGFAVTVDTDFEQVSRAIVVAVSGAVSVQTSQGRTFVIPMVIAGVPFPIRATRVNSSGTAAGTAAGAIGALV